MSSPEQQIEENIEVFRRVLEIWNGNTEPYDELFAPDLLVHTPVDTFEGRDEYREWVEETREAVPDFHAELEAVFGDDDTVAARFTQRGTQIGTSERLELPATGEEFELPGANFARIQNGRCVEMWTYYDQMGLVEQLGLLPDSPGKILKLLLGQVKQRLGGSEEQPA